MPGPLAIEMNNKQQTRIGFVGLGLVDIELGLVDIERNKSNILIGAWDSSSPRPRRMYYCTVGDRMY
jgi:hypothetical protein